VVSSPTELPGSVWHCATKFKTGASARKVRIDYDVAAFPKTGLKE